MSETSNSGILRYYDLPAVECGQTAFIADFGITLACQKPQGHDGMHGNGPFIEYSTEWRAGEDKSK